MENLFFIKKKLSPKMLNSIKVKTKNEKEKRQVIDTIRSLKFSYYMIPICKQNFITLALMLKEVRSI